MIHAARNILRARKFTPQRVVLTERMVCWHIFAETGVKGFLCLKHCHQCKVPVVIFAVTPGAHIVQQMRWSVKAISFLNGGVAPSRLCKLRESQEIHALSVNGRIIGALWPPLFGRSIVLVPHGNFLCFCLKVPHDPFLLAREDAHDLVVHVVMDRGSAHLSFWDFQVPEVVFVQLSHPRLTLDVVTIMTLPTVDKPWHVEFFGHSIWHLRNDVFCPLRIFSACLDEVADACPRLHIRNRVFRAVDELTLDLLPTVVSQPIFISPLDLCNFIAKHVHDVLIRPVDGR
mmetsp:Transcript_40596/g.73068  ORF Transcript_40596/g.73068 Transcript_40596/m.73068 type:complete len:287 (+) Transcript_40596:378-1238(+)